jgi:dienelactone hydrolase
MFDKVEVKETHMWFTPARLERHLPLLIMSHGSGGISDIDIDFAKLACSEGYQVAIIDHFTKRNVKSQLWHDVENIYPSFADRAVDIYTVAKQYNTDKKILFGISAGGTACLLCSKDFDKTFLAYPALIGITSPMLEAKNVTIVTGKDDNWTPPDQAKRYAKHVDCDLHIIDGHHGFLNPRENRQLDNVISLRNVNLPIPFEGTLNEIKYEKGVTAKYNVDSRIYTENLFVKWLS